MEPRLAERQQGEARRKAREVRPPARPLVRASGHSAMYFPLVVLIAVLPGLYALNWWDLNLPGPWWGLRGLAVRAGWAFDQAPAITLLGNCVEAKAVALQPPLYAWLEAVVLAFSPQLDPVATILPSYVAGALVVVLVYLHGRLWGGPGLGLIAATLTGFNRDLLVQMQQASPTTLGLAGALAALLAYGRHLDSSDGPTRPWVGGSWVTYGVGGGLALGLSLLALRGLALAAIPIVLLHQGYLRSDRTPVLRPARWWRAWRGHPHLAAGTLALALGLALAVPWYIPMSLTHGPDVAQALLEPPDLLGGDHRFSGLLASMVAMAPATLTLGLFGAARALRRALTAETDDRATVGGAFWVAWLAIAALLPALWPGGPRSALALWLLVPLNLLAAAAMKDLATRRLPAQTLAWLAPATTLALAWWASTHLRDAVADVLAGRRVDSASALGLHLGLDLVVVGVLILRGLDRWARRRDDRQRLVLGGFLLVVLTATIGMGLKEVRFRNRETVELLTLRDIILRRQQDKPFTLLAVVGPGGSPRDSDRGPSGGRLLFILRSTLPQLDPVRFSQADDLLNLPDGQRLVIMIGPEARLPYSIQSQLGLEEIHPGRSGILSAFATSSPDDPHRASGLGLE